MWEVQQTALIGVTREHLTPRKNAYADRQSDETARPGRNSTLLSVFLQSRLNTMLDKRFARFKRTIAFIGTKLI